MLLHCFVPKVKCRGGGDLFPSVHLFTSTVHLSITDNTSNPTDLGDFSSLQCCTWNKSPTITGQIKVTYLWPAGLEVDCIIPRWRHVHYYIVFLLLTRWWPDNGGYQSYKGCYKGQSHTNINYQCVSARFDNHHFDMWVFKVNSQSTGEVCLTGNNISHQTSQMI